MTEGARVAVRTETDWHYGELLSAPGEFPVKVRIDTTGKVRTLHRTTGKVVAVYRLVSKQEIADALGLDVGKPLILDLKGTREAADSLRVERPRIGKWMSVGTMPEVAGQFRAGPVFWRDDVETLRPGRVQRARAAARAAS